MSCSHSLCGLPLLFVSSILPNISSFIFLLLCILHMCPNSPSFLPISFCKICSFSCIRPYKSVFFTFCVHPILSIFLQHFLSKANILFSISFVTTHASHPYSRILKTHVCNTLFFVSISIDLLFQTFSMAFSAAVALLALCALISCYLGHMSCYFLGT